MFGYASGLGNSFDGPKGFALTPETADALKKLRNELRNARTYKVVLRHQASQSRYHCHIHFDGDSGPAYGCAAATPADAMSTLADNIKEM